MSEEVEFFDDSSAAPVEKMSLIEIWVAALTKPKEETFVKIAAQPDISTMKSFLWVMLASLLSAFFGLVAQPLKALMSGGKIEEMLPVFLQAVAGNLGLDEIGIAALGVGALIGGVPLIAGFTVVGFAIYTGVAKWLATRFGTTISYEKLVYVFSAIAVPVLVVSSVFMLLGAVPLVGIFFLLLEQGIFLYALILSVLALKAVGNIETKKAVGATVLPILVVFMITTCCTVVFMTVLFLTNSQ